MKTRIEINDLGEFFTIIPDDVVADLDLDEGEQIEWHDEDGAVLLTFG